MGKTQQDFAVYVLDCAISTLGRYETSDPPRGDVLLKLAEIADKNNQPSLAATFRVVYLDEVVEKLGGGITATGGSGYVFWKLNTPEELELVMKTNHELEAMRGRREPGYVHPLQRQFEKTMANNVGKSQKRKKK